MKARQLFFLSLIILSIVMGLNWFKNRPKPESIQMPAKNLQANPKIFQITDGEIDDENENEDEDEEEESVKKSKKIDKEDSKEKENNNEEDKSKEAEKAQTAQTEIQENPLKDDPLMQDYFKISRNPFEISPYTKLIEKLKLEAELAAHPKNFFLREEVKVPKLLPNAKFTASIETDRGLAALINGSLYSVGEEFNGRIIKEIKFNMIKMESEKDIWLLPKTGVKITIDNDTGEYTVDDSFE